MHRVENIYIYVCVGVLVNTCVKFDEDWGGPCTSKYIKIVILNFKQVND